MIINGTVVTGSVGNLW